MVRNNGDNGNISIVEASFHSNSLQDTNRNLKESAVNIDINLLTNYIDSLKHFKYNFKAFMRYKCRYLCGKGKQVSDYD